VARLIIGVVASDQITSSVLGTESFVSQGGTAICGGNKSCGTAAEITATVLAGISSVLPNPSPLSRETVDLYRAVGIREYESIMKNKAFLPGTNSLEGRQFAMTLEEALEYANIDPNKVAIIKATVDKNVLQYLDFSKTIDTFIFKNGVITVQPGVQSQMFHQFLKSIEHVF
jgi:hypothetical protein